MDPHGQQGAPEGGGSDAFRTGKGGIGRADDRLCGAFSERMGQAARRPTRTAFGRT